MFSPLPILHLYPLRITCRPQSMFLQIYDGFDPISALRKLVFLKDLAFRDVVARLDFESISNLA